MLAIIGPPIFVLALLILLALLERVTHNKVENIGASLFLTAERAALFHAIIFLPGVFLHEASHWIAAQLLGLSTGRFSIFPERTPDGIRLGYVEVGSADPLRESLVGIAPLIAGSLTLAVIGNLVFDTAGAAAALAVGDIIGAAMAVARGVAWSWAIWLYLCFAIANSMMPSPSDRRAWFPAAVILLMLAVAAQSLGLTAEIARALTAPAQKGLIAVAIAFSVAVTANLAAIPLLHILETSALRRAQDRRRRLGM